VDLAEYSTVVPEAVTVRFIGYRLDGSTVAAECTTDGIIDGTGPLADFQTFSFQGFTSISRLEIFASYASIDNFVIRVGPDQDDDGIADSEDQCPHTPLGAVVNENGCTIDQLVPCDGPAEGGKWRNHGQYVSAVSAAAEDFWRAGLITAAERDDTVRAAAGTNCGKK
jgi:hypothetical protein